MSTATKPLAASRTEKRAIWGRTRIWGVGHTFTLVLFIGLSIYFITPIVWLVISATKSTADLQSTFGFAFGDFDLGKNLVDLFTQDGAIFGRWLVNSALYAGIGALGSTLISALGGYALDKYRFRGRETIFTIIMAGIVVPQTVLALPLFLLMSSIGMVNTYWAVLLPSLVSPFGVYLCRVYAGASVPNELIEAGRIDGAGEIRIFGSLALRIMSPALVTVFLFQFVAIWNNFFLPLIVLRDSTLYPVTLGLYSWNSIIKGNPDLLRLVVTGSVVSVIPLAILFFTLQRYWKAGIAAGSVK